MLPRTEFEVSEDIRDFSVILADGHFVGCGALHFYTPSIGEIRSLAVAPESKTHGIGRRLIDAFVEWCGSRETAGTASVFDVPAGCGPFVGNGVGSSAPGVQSSGRASYARRARPVTPNSSALTPVPPVVRTWPRILPLILTPKWR